MKTKYFLMSAITISVTAIAMLIYIPTVKADTGIEHAKVYDDEYINEIKNGDNSLTKTERETLVKAYNRINELQSEIDSIYDNIEDLNIKAERIVDTKYIEDELNKSTTISETEKQTLLSNHKEMDKLYDELYPLYDKNDNISDEDSKKIEELEKKLDELFDKNIELEKKAFGDSDITPVPYDSIVENPNK